MEATPIYLSGRGRGRGRGNTSQNQVDQRSGSRSCSQLGKNAMRDSQQVQDLNSTQQQNTEDVTMANSQKGGTMPDNAKGKFIDAVARHQQAAQHHLESAMDDYESSEEEEELNDDEILTSVIKNYSITSDSIIAEVGPTDLGHTEEYLSNSMKSKSNVCLICIETIKRVDAIWSCKCCYCLFHINCIQKWVKDGVYQQILQSEENISGKDLPWNCPKCRYEYKQSCCPTRYECFCGKEYDPAPDPWLVPHSCGQVCAKPLKPDCGHTCLLLCHPGPCPPCPKTVSVSCYCGQKMPKLRRCGARKWSCGQPCRKALSCGHHQCKAICHDGDCPPCPEKSTQPCQCGRETTLRPCADPVWQCAKVCGSLLPCGHHTCEKICHSGPCGSCPRSGKRTCPCKKTVFELPCTEDVPTCMDTCGKLLKCGKHTCPERCHYGECGLCREMVRKKCRCGKKEREIQCYKEFLCDTKCPNLRDCGKHNCKRKCCDGSCPPCDQPCNKPLGCRNHKCSSRCHKGRCYPCPLTITISCNCGSTSITVPCGREKVTKPPKCSKNCRKRPDCHHPARLPHRCHFGYCPPCTQICNKKLSCGHQCPAICHTAVLTKIQAKVQRVGPWEAQPEPEWKLIDHPCPPCQVPTKVSCLGQHEIVSMPCSLARVASCHRPCGRLLECTNHTCQLECHTVEDAVDEQSAGSNCQKCEDMCSKVRPEGCSHQCLLACHAGLCPPCTQMIRMRCHCRQLVLHVECDQWTHADDTERQRLQSCHSICPKTLACGHQCKATCHPGPCPSPERCVEKVTVHCKCRHRKRNFLCNEIQAGYGKVECDESCEQHKEKLKREKEEKLKAEKEAARRREEEEIAEFRRKMEPRKRKPRKQKQVVVETGFLQKYGKFIVAPFLVVVFSMFAYYLFSMS